MTANKTDVVHVVAQLIDEERREVKHVEDEITFQVGGAHRFLGTDCGDTAKLANFKSRTVPTAFGRCLMLLQATGQPSTLSITARAADGAVLSNKATVVVEE